MKKVPDMTRRDFISKGTAAAPLVLTFANKSFAKVSNEALNVGVIGVGRRGQNARRSKKKRSSKVR